MDPVMESLDTLLRAIYRIPLMVLGVGTAAIITLLVAGLLFVKIWSMCAHAKGGR